jgi:hypothetical protein
MRVAFAPYRSPVGTLKHGEAPTPAAAPRPAHPKTWDALCATMRCGAPLACPCRSADGRAGSGSRRGAPPPGGSGPWREPAPGVAWPSPAGPALRPTSLPGARAAHTRAAWARREAPDGSPARRVVCRVLAGRASGPRGGPPAAGPRDPRGPCPERPRPRVGLPPTHRPSAVCSTASWRPPSLSPRSADAAL